MKVQLQCRACQAEWTLNDEPRALVGLRCPSCGATADARASEDVASALEDALAQLWRVRQTIELEVSLSTRAIPPAFEPDET